MFDLPKYGDGVGLTRMADLLDAIEVDRTRLRRVSVVVTGSNGKGSTAAFCAGIAHAYRLRTGLFTSPHLHHFNERFQVDGVPIGDDTLARLKLRVETAIAGLSQRYSEKFGAFEAMFALACLYFQESECDFAVFEAGIGGRYDPARLVGALCTCVTSVDYEHIELLGHSLELIVSDKSDACASGGTIVYGENCRNLRPHILEYNRHRDITAVFVRDQIAIDNEAISATGQRFDFQFGDYEFRVLETSLLGAFQINDAAIAVTLFLLWLRRMRPGEAPAKIEAAVRSGLRAARWPGRLELIRRQPLTMIDVGHTPDGIRQSLASLKAIHGADELDPRGRHFLRQEGRRDRRVAGAVIRHHHLHRGAPQGRERGEYRRLGAKGQSGRRRSDRRNHRGRDQHQPKARHVAKTENICSRRIIPGDRIRDHRPRRTRARPGFFLNSQCERRRFSRGARSRSVASDEFEQRIANMLYDAVPFAGLALAEQTRGRIPGAVIPVEQPAPIGHMRQQYPDRFSQPTRKMRDSGVNRYHKIKMRYQRCGVGKTVKLVAEMNDVSAFPKRRRIPRANLFLQADKCRVDVLERQQTTQIDRPFTIPDVL